MIGINSAAIHRRVSFGAADVAPVTQVYYPAPLSGTPIKDKNGDIENDPYGVKKQRDLTQSSEYEKYLHHSNKKEHPSILPALLGIVALGTAGFVGIKNRKAIGNFFKKLFKGENTVKKHKKSDIRPPETYTGLKAFEERFSEMTKLRKEDDLDSFEPSNFRVIFNENSSKEKRKALEKLYEMACVYTQKDRQPKVLLLMPESMEEHADNIVDLFGKNRIDEIESKHLDKIEGFQIVNADKRGYAERTDIIVDKKVRHSVNAGNATDVAYKWLRNASEFVKERL